MSEIKLKFKAFYNGVEINDGDYFRPDKMSNGQNLSASHNSYECVICSHGILWTNKLSKRDNYIELKNENRTETYYQDWESLHLLSEKVVIEVIT